MTEASSQRILHPRRRLLRHAAAAGLALLGAGTSGAQTWPSKPVRIVVPYVVGGTSDAAARLLAERMQLGQPVVVENRGGAGGVTGMDLVAKAAPDGHTLAFAAISPLTLSPHLQHVPYDPLKDIVPVARVMFSPVYLVATSAFAGKSFADVISAAKAAPGKLMFATSGMGSLGHLMLEQISRRANVKLNHIPYKGGGQVTNDAASGQFDLFTANPSPAVNALIAQGRLRVLAVAAPRRLPTFPDVPTFEELGQPDANLSSVFGIFAPAHTPPAVLARLNTDINRLLASKDIEERLARLDNIVSPASAEEFTNQVQREYAANAKVVKEADIKIE